LIQLNVVKVYQRLVGAVVVVIIW